MFGRVDYTKGLGDMIFFFSKFALYSHKCWIFKRDILIGVVLHARSLNRVGEKSEDLSKLNQIVDRGKRSVQNL